MYTHLSFFLLPLFENYNLQYIRNERQFFFFFLTVYFLIKCQNFIFSFLIESRNRVQWRNCVEICCQIILKENLSVCHTIYTCEKKENRIDKKKNGDFTRNHIFSSKIVDLLKVIRMYPFCACVRVAPKAFDE